ncbi:hypothetical protein ISS30_09220 [bacterium]|nr:hypothetical protein [FCB group bacterium]MBL7191866.1 hypothetical protein [bacterium]
MSVIEVLRDEINRMTLESPFHLMDIKLAQYKNSASVRIFLDREDCSLSHEDCRQWSRDIQDFIDSKMLIKNDYRLEISSPGVTHPLKYEWEYRKNMGRELILEITQEDEKIINLKGKIISADDKGIIVESQNGPARFLWDKIKKAQVQTPW